MIREIVESYGEIAISRQTASYAINNKLDEAITIENEVVVGLVKLDVNMCGIVYTPIDLVQKILGLIPDKYFSDPELKWLDVGAGTGAFSCVLYCKLYEGLRGVISDHGERHHHIITKMMYMVENYPVHIVKLQQIFGLNANIIDKDFLSGEIASHAIIKKCGEISPHAIIKNSKNVAKPIKNNKNVVLGQDPIKNVVWGQDPMQDPIPTFDFIIGNPPYNTGGKIKTPTNKNASKKEDGVAAYVEFVKKSLKMLRYGGFLNMIIPNIWMKPDKAGLYNLLTGLNIMKLCCLSAGQTNRVFKYQAQTPTSFFLIENVEDPNNGYKRIQILDMDKNVAWGQDPSSYADKNVVWGQDPIPFATTRYRMLQNWPIPCHSACIVNRLIKYVEKPEIGHLSYYKTNGCSKNISVVCENDKDDSHKYCNIKTCYIGEGLKPFLIYNWSCKPCPYYGVPKLVLAHKMYGFPYLDISGEYGISTRDNYVISGQDYSVDELREIGAFLSTRFALYIFSTCNYRMRYLERYAFYFIPAITRIEGFPKLEKIKDRAERDTKIYDFFRLVMEERAIIENGFKDYQFFL